MSDRRRKLGALGERLARQHLAALGYEVVERNFRTRHGEIDVVARDSSCVVFCEVKTRVAHGRSGALGPLDSIGPRKRRQVRRIAAQWLSDRTSSGARLGAPELRFDAIGVTLAPGGQLLELEHIENAF